mmetsp:Transcript_38432/g.76984  ORF Transcript_38432/g.76984 Transcript_38432/m.76984 type:complete len:427 (-) Transcript_38432:427-1707(-)
MISAVYLINLKGEILIYRSYRDDVTRAAADAFRMQVLAAKEFRSPVQIFEKASFFHVRSSNVYLVAATRENVNAAMVFQFLFALVDVFKGYFGGDFNEDAVRDNFPLVYELLDETMDFGYPQSCSVDLLKTFIMQEGQALDPARALVAATLAPAQVTGAVSWRREGIKYRKNEVFLDVVEHVNLLMSNKGTVLRSDVTGEVVMKTYLTGMPECKFGLNDKLMMQGEGKRRESGSIEMEDVSFHQCVKLGKFDSDKAVTFIPPDGEFILMKYRVSENINLPFHVLPIVKELGRTRLEVNVKVKAQYSSVTGLNVIVRIPLPPNTAKVTPVTAAGKAKYEPETSELVWRMRKFPGDTEYALSAEVEMSARIEDKKAWSRPPISMEYQVPMLAASGLHVRFLKIYEKSNYNTIKWVRYISKNGQYLNRI